MRILLSGSAGYIGSRTYVPMPQAGHKIGIGEYDRLRAEVEDLQAEIESA